MKFNKTALGVIAFIVVLILAGYSARSEADNGARIGVGKTLINSHLKVGEIGYEYNDWEFSATILEEGQTKNGFQSDNMHIYSASYLTKPKWGVYGVDPYFRLGVSYNDGSKLIGNSNFRLGVGLDFHDVWRVEFSHHSSAGIHNPNTGLDYITLTYKIPPMF